MFNFVAYADTATTTTSGSGYSLVSFLPLILLIAVMYFLMIRPQKKKDKEVQEMRNALHVGDDIVTIGGIMGKIVKTNDETIVIQVGADKTKMELQKWAVSSVIKKSAQHQEKAKEVKEEVKEEPKAKKLPKKLNKKEEPKAEEVDVKAEAKAEVETPVETPVEVPAENETK